MLPKASFATHQEQKMQREIARAAFNQNATCPDAAAYSMVVANTPNTLKYLQSRLRTTQTPAYGQINY